jgi:hypothetical protein
VPENFWLQEVALITLMAISIVFYGLSLRGGLWRPKWANADPGINVLRCLFVAVLLIAAVIDVSWGVEAWFGTLDQGQMHSLFLKTVSGLAIMTYWARKVANRSTPGQ